MKIIKQAVIILCLLLPCLAQEKPVPELFDTFGTATCDELGTRLHLASTALANNPNSIIYIIIYGKKDNGSTNYILEGRIQSRIAFQRIDKSRIVIAHAAPVGDIKTELWLIPPGADKPVFEEIKPVYSLQIDKPVIYYQEGYYIADECPVNIEEIYPKILIENANLHGNIVIYENSAGKFRKEKRRLTAEFVKNYKVPVKRINFYFVKPSDRYHTGIEYWLVPSRKK